MSLKQKRPNPNPNLNLKDPNESNQIKLYLLTYHLETERKIIFKTCKTTNPIVLYEISVSSDGLQGCFSL